jgi:hypothetical protein
VRDAEALQVVDDGRRLLESERRVELQAVSGDWRGGGRHGNVYQTKPGATLSIPARPEPDWNADCSSIFCMNARLTSAVALLALAAASCGGRTVVTSAKAPVPQAKMAELWVDPGTTPRDLFWGVGGQRRAPAPDAVYKLLARDETGFSVSYDVVGPDGMEWSAKIGPEAQTEVVVSRILWALGFHQPPIYYLPSWKLDTGEGEPRVESEARFRPKLEGLERLDEYWYWADNPFSGTRELKGLLVVLLMLNSSDLKDDNNSIYELKEPWDGASRWFVVRDVGAALGVTGKLYPRRNWLEGFEKAGFITAVHEDGSIDFDYDGRHEELLSMIAVPDVQWAATRMQRLSDDQWRAAFRAGNYAPAVADRFIRRIEKKIADGLALRADATAPPR